MSMKTSESAAWRLTNVMSLSVVLLLVLISGLMVAIFSRLSTSPGDVYSRVEKAEKKMTAKLDEQHTFETAYHAALEQSKDSIVGVNKHGVIVLFSEGAVSMFNTPRESAMGYGLRWMINDEDLNNHSEAFRGAMEDNQPGKSTVECETPYGRMRIHVRYWPGSLSIARFEKVE